MSDDDDLIPEHVVVALDAQDRAFRTFMQGIGIDVVVALSIAMGIWVVDADITSKEAWIVLATTGGKTLIITVTSYVVRLKIPPNIS